MAIVTLISHASVVIEANGTKILTDPWLSGKCFNQSWSLLAQAAEIDLDDIDFLWISHEHPDHFHIPSLKALSETFKRRAQVLVQRSSDCGKMAAALQGLGFQNIRLLPHGAWQQVGAAEVLCYPSRQIDSALAVRGDGTVLNLNDCDFGPADFSALRRMIGEPDVVLNQFSLAGFDGDEEKVPRVAARILDDMVAAHRNLGAGVTIPFASFAYFCCQDNAFLNAFANTPRIVAERFQREGLDLAVLKPGQTFRGAICNEPALEWWDEIFAAPRRITTAGHASLGELKTAFHRMRAKLKAHHGEWIRLLRPIVVDTGECRLNLDFAGRRIAETLAAADVEIATQPLLFMLSNTFGLQTLGVSGRYRLLKRSRNWTLHRVLFAMMNAGIGLSVRKLLSLDQLRFFWSRRNNIFRQVAHTLKRAGA
jgi:UDP-MurNAc hydroxylase